MNFIAVLLLLLSVKLKLVQALFGPASGASPIGASSGSPFDASVNCAGNTLLTVEYSGCEPVVCDGMLTEACIQTSPSVSMSAGNLKSKKYALLMLGHAEDPPNGDYYVHWFMYDIPKSSIVSGSLEGGIDATCPYQPPSLPSGPGFHHYKFFLFQQNDNLVSVGAFNMVNDAPKKFAEGYCSSRDHSTDSKGSMSNIDQLRFNGVINIQASNNAIAGSNAFRQGHVLEVPTTQATTTRATTTPSTTDKAVNCAGPNLLTVEYNGCEPVECNGTLTSACTESAPRVSIDAAALGDDKYYLLIMEDHDAPVDDTIFVHWIMYDIPKSSLVSGSLEGGTEAASCSYRAPTPPAGSGYHRYQFFLLEQTGSNSVMSQDVMFQSFSLNAKMAMSNLCYQNGVSTQMYSRLKLELKQWQLVKSLTVTAETMFLQAHPSDVPTTTQATTASTAQSTTKLSNSTVEQVVAIAETTTADEALVLNQQDEESASAITRDNHFVLLLLLALIKLLA